LSVIETKRVVPHRKTNGACGDPFRGTIVVEIRLRRDPRQAGPL